MAGETFIQHDENECFMPTSPSATDHLAQRIGVATSYTNMKFQQINGVKLV